MVDFGRDIDCTDSLRTGRYVTGTRLVAQAIYRRLITERGSLRGGEDEANYGLDLTRMIGQSTTRTSARVWEGRIRGEALKDPRVQDCVATVVAASNGVGDIWTVTVDCTTAAGPFQLVLGVSDVTTRLVGLVT